MDQEPAIPAQRVIDLIAEVERQKGRIKRLEITVKHLIDALANQLIAKEGQAILSTSDETVFYDRLKAKLAPEGLKPISEYE